MFKNMLKFVIIIITINTINNVNTQMCPNEVIEESCLTFIDTITTLVNDYKNLLKSSPKYLCHLKVKRTVEKELQKLRKLIDDEIKDTGKDHLTNLNDMIKILEIAKNEYLEPKPKNNTDDDELLHLGHDSFNQLISSIYNNNLTNAEKVIDFFDSLPDDDETIQGYRLLFDQMKKNDHLYSTLTTTIGYRVLNFMKERKSENENLLYIRDNLPESLKNFTSVWFVYIKNFRDNEILATGFNEFMYDTQRRWALTYSGNYCPILNQYSTCDWILSPISNGRHFHIYIDGFDNKQYLYADTNEFARDTQRRHVFLSKKDKQPFEKARWLLEPIPGSDYFKIKNIYWNEYLYIEEGLTYDQNPSFRHVFTWRPGGCEHDGCRWKILRRNR